MYSKFNIKKYFIYYYLINFFYKNESSIKINYIYINLYFYFIANNFY